MPKKDTTVGAHFKPSLGRVVDTYTRQQDVTDTANSESASPPPAAALAALVGTPTKKPTKLTFPVESYKPPKRGFWRRHRDALGGSVTRVPEKFGDVYYWSYRNLNRRGEGLISAEKVHISGKWYASLCPRQEVGPNQTIDDETFLTHVDYSNTNMPDLETRGNIRNVNWAGANLHDARFTGKGSTKMYRVNFDGADLTNGEISNMELSEVSMRGADLTGFTFDIYRRGYLRENDEFDIDFTDSNVTAEQFDSVADAIRPPKTFTVNEKMGTSNRIRINRYTPQEFCVATGMDEDELTVLLWTGEIEYRSKATDMVETGEFDAAIHYIPQWEAQRVLQT